MPGRAADEIGDATGKPAPVPLRYAFPTNPLERLSGEIRRPSDVVGISADEAAVTRLIGALLLDQNDEWAIQWARSMTLETIAPLSGDPLVNLPSLAACSRSSTLLTRSCC